MLKPSTHVKFWPPNSKMPTSDLPTFNHFFPKPTSATNIVTAERKMQCDCVAILLTATWASLPPRGRSLPAGAPTIPSYTVSHLSCTCFKDTNNLHLKSSKGFTIYTNVNRIARRLRASFKGLKQIFPNTKTISGGKHMLT